MEQVVNGLLYDTAKATEIASNYYWDGHNHDRQGRNTYLYKTKKSNFFALHTTRWEGERDNIEPITEEEAMGLYEQLPEKSVDYATAFGVEPEEA